MIIDLPILSNLAVGADRVQPQDGDSQAIIPNVISPTVLPLYAHDLSSNTAELALTSKLTTQAQVNLNQAASTSDLVTLPKGLYTFQISMAVRSNFTTTVLTESVALTLFYQGTSKPIVEVMANIETVNINTERYYLLTSQSVIRFLIPATNAVGTNSIAIKLAVNVIRHI